MLLRAIYLTLVFISSPVYPQVGIGTTNPSEASMLEIRSSTDGISFHGFLLPRVNSNAERDQINTTINDMGLLVFVNATGSLSIWNGIGWETVYTLLSFPTVLVQQDFDSSNSWSYTNSPAFYAVGNDIFDVTTNLGSGDTSAINNVNANFVAYRDLNNTNGGGNFDHNLIFDNVDVSSLSNPKISFDWDVFEFDNGDYMSYEVFLDDVGQGVVSLFSGASTGSGLSGQGTEIITIPASTTLARITVMVHQNGDGDFAAVDNFLIYSN